LRQAASRPLRRTLDPMSDLHVNLFAGESHGQRVCEPVHVTQVRDGVYRVLFSPGLVYGLAAEDEIKLLEDGQFTVVSRGQNLAVRVYFEMPVADLTPVLTRQVELLGGRLDGQVRSGIAFTIPVVATFKAVEAIFNNFVAAHPGSEWEFGNVFDEQNRPLCWWPAGV
jgi:hypothetical protein